VRCAKRASKKKEKNIFSASRGGIVCERCFSGEQDLAKISSDQIKLLRIFLANPLEKILKVKVDEAELRGLGRIRLDLKDTTFSV